MNNSQTDPLDPSEPPATETPDGSGPVSFAKDILPLFNPSDISCMSGFGVYLDNYDYMSDSAGGYSHATAVYGHLVGTKQPKMPLGGPYWTPDQLLLLHSWMTVAPAYQP